MGADATPALLSQVWRIKSCQLFSEHVSDEQVRAMGYTGGSNEKRSSTSSGGNGKSRPRSNGGGGGRRRDYDGDDTSDEEAGGGEGDGTLDCDESLDAAATDDEVCHRSRCLSRRRTPLQQSQ